MSVLVLNWNGERFLQPCLHSVMKDACRHVDVVLVDNASTDDSVDYARRQFPDARIISFPENLGFGGAYNAAVRQVSGRFVVFLNNDTVVESGWLAPLVDELIRDVRIGITTSKVLFLGTRVLNAAGGQLKLWQGAGELGFGRDEAFMSDRRVVEPFYASGSAMAMSRQLFLRLDGFDLRLCPYGEDLDLSWRARLAGYTIRFVPQSIVYHHYSGTSGAFRPINYRLGTTHNLAAMIKCLSAANLLHTIPAFTLFSFAKGAGLSIAMRHSAYFTNVFLSLRDVVLDLGDLRRRRRETQRLRVAPDRSVLRSDGFGLFDPPWVLLRLLRQAQQIKGRLSQAEDAERSSKPDLGD